VYLDDVEQVLRHDILTRQELHVLGDQLDMLQKKLGSLRGRQLEQWEVKDAAST
jgi:hypothetical protein